LTDAPAGASRTESAPAAAPGRARGAAPQQRVTGAGELRRWSLDVDAVRARISWAAPDAGAARLAAEAAEMAEHFPTWVAALGRQGPGDYWETGELPAHDACGAPWVFDRGVRCGDCGAPVPPAAGGAAAAGAVAGAATVGSPGSAPAAPAALPTPLLAFVGRIPAVVDERPMLAKVRAHLAALRGAGARDRAAALRSYFVKAEGRTFFAPPVFAYLPAGWPRTDPYVMVHADYFAVLDIPPSHVYPSTSYRLCNYAQWRDVTLRTVLQQRVVPRVLIDLMLADLRAMDCLPEALEEARVDMHSVYNVIGRPAQSGEFARVYEQRRAQAR